jgi:DNA-binding HxlR family transcriptional regulator
MTTTDTTDTARKAPATVSTPGPTAAAKRHDRTYGQFCPIAAGLDLVGDRWVLLICRELSHGDQRFTDLKSGLPGIAPNLLSERLRTLQDAGLVVTAELPPPAARTVYRLSAEGRRVIPVLRAMARFGAPYLDEVPPSSVRARRAAFAFLVPWWRQPATDSAPTRSRLVLDDVTAEAVDLVADGGTLHVEAVDPDAQPDVVVTTTATQLMAARKGDGAIAADVAGTASARRAFSEAFDLRLASA